MVLVAVMAFACVGIERSGVPARRSLYLGSARESRRYETELRSAAEQFENCRAGHENVDRQATRCRVCREAWNKSRLKDQIRTPAEAVVALRQSADILGRWAERFERGASRPWVELPRPTPAEYQPVRSLKEGDGPIHRGYFDAY